MQFRFALEVVLDRGYRYPMPILPGSCLQWAQEMGWLWEVPSLPVKLAMHPLAPSVLGLRPKPPPSRREVLWRAATVNACTVPMFSLPILLGNVTGHWRGSNDSLKATVRNWLRTLPAGDSPPIPG